MTTKHTPGPWLVERNQKTSATWNILASGIRIAEVLAGPSKINHGFDGNIYVDRDDAVEGPHNARLIAAAPDLLAALEGMLDNYLQLKHMSLVSARSDCPDWMPSLTVEDDVHVIAVRAAIAKATQS